MHTNIFCMLCIVCIVSIMTGCASGGIPLREYPSFQNPQETLDFVKKSVVKDDPNAFYECLSQESQKIVPLSDLKMAWNLAGGYFFIFLDTEVKYLGPIQKDDSYFYDKPIYWQHPNFNKVTLASHGMEASFLLLQEEKKWKIIFPSPYPLPSVNQLPKRQRIPWREENYIHCRANPQEWLYPQKITRSKNNTPNTSKRIFWRE